MSVCHQPQVKSAVCERRMDLSVSVRQAVMDLVGKHIHFSPQFTTDYVDMVLDRLAVRGTTPRHSSYLHVRALSQSNIIGYRNKCAQKGRQDVVRYLFI